MAPHALAGAFHRVDRAEEHLADLEPRLAALVVGLNPDAISVKYETEPPYDLLIEHEILTNFAAPMRLPILIGETCYNLRCAMEYLVAALAQLDSGREQPMTQFPIVGSAEKFASRKTRDRLKGINDSHVAMIERLQPFRGCEWARHLREISNRDKHVEFITAALRRRGKYYESFSDPLYSTRVLPEYSAHHPIYGKVHVKLDLALKIALVDGTPIIEALQKIKAGVTQALTDFAPDF